MQANHDNHVVLCYDWVEREVDHGKESNLDQFLLIEGLNVCQNPLEKHKKKFCLFWLGDIFFTRPKYSP